MYTLSSRAKSINNGFAESKREKGNTNIDWLRSHWRPDRVAMLLVGGTDLIHFRLRIAQSHLRNDLTPSHWSHVALLDESTTADLYAAPLYEISLTPAGGFGFPTARNCLQNSALEKYGDPKLFPNIGILYLPPSVEPRMLMNAVERFQQQRIVIDAVQLLLAWLGYAWGAGRAGNPLLDGLGMPSAAMLETVTGAAGFDLTPGLESRASCPEAIWQSARWWHEYHEENKEGPITGAFYTPHRLPAGQ
ncbi:hypothetical protein SAMN05216299_106131 [Nitrosospira sp. Nsp14]|uniref:hypothetical protein n=1 Tax=Nitrosospira sp. Nsp14 TaxID=1855333 RepID=UPI0008EAD7F5|nr:hypothetical protein [Nitrosospira sp. Nsp14]SFH31939.1 hypothetical protein SAMN05216299_106131 [Nitrosospira sp. Nsp14]